MKYKNEEREKEGFSIEKDSELTQEKAMASNSLTILQTQPFGLPSQITQAQPLRVAFI